MGDMRERLLNDIQSAVALSFNNEITTTVAEIVLTALEKYEVTERCTEVAVRPTLNENILNTYRGCLIVDGKSEKTIDTYMLALSKFAEFCRKSLLEVTTYDIRLYLAKKLKMGNSARSISVQRAVISAFYGWLVDNKHLEVNPCTPIKPTKYKKEIKTAFSKSDIDSLRSVCPTSRDRAIVEFLLSTGVRVSELTAITIDDIDFEEKTVLITNGKGNKERVVYFNDITAKCLKSYISDYNITDGILFIGKRGAMTKNGIETLLKKLGENCGLDEVHPHRFRRTFATELSKNGCPVTEIQKLLGHSNINTTMTYIALSDESTKEAYETYAV